MAHEIAFTADNKPMMAFRGETPWHSLGTNVEGFIDGESMLKAANLDWQVRKAPMGANIMLQDFKATGWDQETDKETRLWVDRESVFASIPDMSCVYRSNDGTILGVVGEDYEVFQNSEVVQFFDGLRSNHSIEYETAGALRNGSIVWMLARIPDLKLNIKGDEINSYMLIQNGHSGKSKLKCTPTTIRVVCANTLKAANKGYAAARKKNGANTIHAGYEIKHTKNMREIVNKVQLAYRNHLEDFKITSDMFNVLADKTVTLAETRNFFDWIVDGDKDETERAKELSEKASKSAETRRKGIISTLENLEASPTNQTGTRGTLFGLLNIGVEFVDHERGTRIADDNIKSDGEGRFLSANFGSGDKMKAEILDHVLELAGV